MLIQVITKAVPIRYRIHQLSISLGASSPPEHCSREIEQKVCSLLKIPRHALEKITIERKSIDARDKTQLSIVYGLLVDLDVQVKLKKIAPTLASPVLYEPPYQVPLAKRSFSFRPIIVGAGPAGLFAALALAEAGLKPLILERGDCIEERQKKVAHFFHRGELDPESNVQFGEGGAGTFSDGKLVSQIKDPHGRKQKVLSELIKAGAPAEIAYLAKPHIGTDKLVGVLVNLRRHIERLGGIFQFRSPVTKIHTRHGHISGVEIKDGQTIETDILVLAPGHSARDLFGLLADMNVAMEPKSFAIGLRIEHPQEMISFNQFGPLWQHPSLPVAEYKLTAQTTDQRPVYSFCMCPGGIVVNSSSELGGIVCNGMSNFSRQGTNANAAIVVAVRPSDFGSTLLSGLEFQRHWEEKAFIAGKRTYALPIQTLSDFIQGRPSTQLGTIQPSITGNYSLADLSTCLPPYVVKGIAQALPHFSHSIKNFDRLDALLSGVETRTSSPLRILRNAQGVASIPGLYPAGEGSGYAGGIMSAAIDGLRSAEKILDPTYLET